MGILDFFGGGQQQGQQGIPETSFSDRLRASYNPELYNAMQQNQQQRAIYDAVLQYSKNPEMAAAMARSPQVYAAQQEAFMPQGNKTLMPLDAQGAQTVVQIGNKGGAAGHTNTLSGLPIAEPSGGEAAPGVAAAPGTTPSAERAVVAAPPGGAGAAAPAPVGVTSANPTNTLQGMPGNIGSTLARLDAAKAAGVGGEDLFQYIPRADQDLVRGYLKGQLTLKDVTERKGNARFVERAALAIEPGFDSAQNDARAAARKDYYDSGINKTGGQLKSYGTVLGHLNSQLDRAISLDNYDTEVNGAPIGGAPGAHLANAIHGTAGNRTGKLNEFDTGRDTLAGETVRFLTGSEGSQKDREEYINKWGAFATPRETAGTAKAYLKMLQDKVNEMNAKHQQNFPNPEIAKSMPIITPEHEKTVAEIQKKIDFLDNRYKGGSAGWKLIK